MYHFYYSMNDFYKHQHQYGLTLRVIKFLVSSAKFLVGISPVETQNLASPTTGPCLNADP